MRPVLQLHRALGRACTWAAGQTTTNLQALAPTQQLVFTQLHSFHSGSQQGSSSAWWSQSAAWQKLAAAAGAATAAGVALNQAYGGTGWASWLPATHADAPRPTDAHGKPWPKFTQEEVAKHNSRENRIWVTYKDGVYDITEFIEIHPGGEKKIMLAAGASVEPFWAMYQQHFKADAPEILKEYQIGMLEGYDPVAAAAAVPKEVWVHEPPRHHALIHRSDNPCNAETPGHIVAANLITPNELHYVRNHLPVPEVDAGSWKLVVSGEGLRHVELTLDQLRSSFPKHTLAATIQCSGNRRHEMKEVKAVKGLDWDVGAIGTAWWGGVRLRDVLQHAGMDLSNPSAAHIQFVGADKDPVTGETYGASIPVDIAVAANRDVLLAYEMNGEPLPADHGFPVRVVAPGVTGARSVKWLTHVVAANAESPSHWQQRDYKSFSPSVDWDNVDWESAPAIQDMPVTSAITEPTPGQHIPSDKKEIKAHGYAWSGGGRDIVRVDVTADGGKSWHTATLRKIPQQSSKAWAWTLWKVHVPVPEGHTGPLQLAVKATDLSYNTQPDSVAAIWNLRGVVNNAWHRVMVHVEDK